MFSKHTHSTPRYKYNTKVFSILQMHSNRSTELFNQLYWPGCNIE